jgi:hypothetical protein
MKRIIAAAVIAASCVSAHAQDWFQYEAGIGASAYSKGPDGYWYQAGFAHNLQLTAPAVEVGFTGDLYNGGAWGVAYHADYAWLGAVHTDAQAVPLDANYNLATKGCNGACLPLARFQGSGHEAGFLLTLEPYYYVGKWRVGVEAGPFLHKTVWSEDVSNVTYSIDQQAAPISIHVASSDGWRVGAVIGASVSYDNFTLAYQHFFTKTTGANPAPAIWHSVDTLLLKYRY